MRRAHEISDGFDEACELEYQWPFSAERSFSSALKRPLIIVLRIAAAEHLDLALCLRCVY